MPDKPIHRTMVRTWAEMNAIRIRSREGVPLGVELAGWQQLMDEIDAYVQSETGHRCWLHPLLYKPLLHKDEGSRDLPELTTEEQVVLLTEVVARLHTRLQLLEAKAVALDGEVRKREELEKENGHA